MGFDRRLLTLFVVLALLGLPAFTLRVLCIGHGCDEPVEATASIPFCSLPSATRSIIAASFREGRSPDVLGVTTDATVAGGDTFPQHHPQPQWPSAEPISRRVPLAFAGAGLPAGDLPSDIGLHDVAPTIANLMGIERPHPEVRSGEPIPGVDATRSPPLVVQIVWKGAGSEELERDPEGWPELREIAQQGLATMDAEVPSLPLDPAAVLTTIGTGGLPAQHGIVGSLVRNDGGRVVEVWDPAAPPSVIAALGDDLDEVTGQRARIGLVASDASDRGAIGKDWYVEGDRDDVTVVGSGAEVIDGVDRLLNAGFGRDDVPDLLAVTLDGPISAMDRVTGAVAAGVRAAVDDGVVVVTATGSSVESPDLTGRQVGRRIDSLLPPEASVVEATAPGGLFLDQGVLADEGLAEDEILDAMGRVAVRSGATVFTEVFPAIAVSFARYC